MTPRNRVSNLHYKSKDTVMWNALLGLPLQYVNDKEEPPKDVLAAGDTG